MPRPPPLPTSSIATFEARSSTRRRSSLAFAAGTAASRSWSPGSGGLLLVALIAQFNYYFVSATPDFWHHYTIQGVLALWAISAVIFQAMLRSGWQSDQVRVLWSAADIAFLTVEIKLFEELLTGSPSNAEVHVETTLLVGYPLLIAASGLWWRVNHRLDHDRAGDVRLHLALRRRGAAVAGRSSLLEPEPRPATSQYLPGGAPLDRLRGCQAGQADFAFEPIL